MISPVQIRMARAALQWGVRDLAKKAKLSPGGVSKIELGKSDARASTLTELQAAFEKAGIVFGADGSVRLVEKRGRK